MPLTILFDLDDTLLGNNIDEFLPGYLGALGKHLYQAGGVDPKRMVKELLAATQKMTDNNDPSRTLEETFDADFYPGIGADKSVLFTALMDFYENKFPSLQALTQMRLAAKQVVQQGTQRGDLMIVATNPLFPQRAIEHRVAWAGFEDQPLPFALLTTYESFHFAKPNPAYFAEILAQVGWPDQPAVMIGNSLTEDLNPAAEIGLPGFLVTDVPVASSLIPHPLGGQGQLGDVPAWLATIEAAGETVHQSVSLKGMIALLRSTPAALDTLVRALDDAQLHRRPAQAEWSAVEILAHMRDVDHEVNLPRLELLLREEMPFLAGINADKWTDERGYQQQDGRAALAGFIAARMRLIARLEALQPADWQRAASHAIFGPTTLRELISFTITHDRSHIQQILAAVRAPAQSDETGKLI